MRSFSFLKLSAVRVAQLRSLAKLRKTTMSGLIAEIINQAIRAGELPDQTPGITFEDRPGTAFTVRVDQVAVRLNLNEVEEFVQALQKIPNDGGVWRAKDGKRTLTLKRRGSSLSMDIDVDGYTRVHKTFARDVVGDVRRQLIASSGWLRTQLAEKGQRQSPSK